MNTDLKIDAAFMAMLGGTISVAFVVAAVTIYLRGPSSLVPNQTASSDTPAAESVLPPIGRAEISLPDESSAENEKAPAGPAASPERAAIEPRPSPPPPVQTAPVSRSLLWGAYIGNNHNNIESFERLVGREIDLYADFEGWHENFPSQLKEAVGASGKTLIIFWEPSFGYDDIIDHSQDEYISKFAAAAKAYGYPVILVPFPEMNLNEEAWGYSVNGNDAEKFKEAWRLVYSLFDGVSNVKFGLAYNHVSVPETRGNLFADYYPGDAYVDYVGIDGFNFRDPDQTFAQIFDDAVRQLSAYGKPMLIFSMAAAAGPDKDEWIREGLGGKVYDYRRVVGWVWFNQGGRPNWLVDSDPESLRAFKEAIPKD